jgi:hypothetical protein
MKKWKGIKILAGILLFALYLPLLQGYLHLIDIPSLQGAYLEPEKPIFNFKNWFSSEYQDKEDLYISKKFGLADFFIRLHNQIDFTFFDKLHSQKVKRGKNDYLFADNYITSYNGYDFCGDGYIYNQVKKIKLIQDTLSKLNKTFILIIAPGKAYFFPEYIPDTLKNTNRNSTNYYSYTKYLKKESVNLIDFNGYFITHKNNSQYLLYPKTGIHWSFYGKVIVMDSIIKYVENKRNIDFPGISWSEVEMSEAKGDDKDIEESLNLLFQIPGPQYAYPKIIFDIDSNKKRPSVWAVGDSFYGGLFMDGFHNIFSKNSQFWYYNVQIMYPNKNELYHRTQFDLTKEIKEHEVFIVSSTEAGLKQIGWNWIENMYHYFYKNGSLSSYDQKFNKYVLEYRNKFEKDSEMMSKTRTDAIANKISVDSMLTLEAIWKVEYDLRDHKLK